MVRGTEEDFRDTLDIVKEAFFGKTHVFRYSPRRGTAGARLKGAVPEGIKKERSAILEEAAEEVARDFRLSITGKEQTVLIEEEEDGYMTGYTGNYIKAYIKVPEGAAVKEPAPGEFCTVIPEGLFRDGVAASAVC